MSIFKCKMCGGTLEINANQTTATCEYCGTIQTLPKLDDERRANLYDRANHFRRNNEFDKAMSIYENILNEDGTDAEAYWSLVLCRYGIEYVEDPTSHKRVPTVNRAQFTSIFDDDNYKSALQYADGHQKAIYEQEANAINEIQKGILAISQKEEPFDVFICYKETDANGRRTMDSVLANDLYHQLVSEGFKVFFSRITLEDKLGVAYEPYIFAALNSAKVMVVLGTKPEYFSAVWVKNEWSRYLHLMVEDKSKHLIPCYKDIDAYDIPKEFSRLQAQDMGKIGALQDLLRGIEKILPKNKQAAPVTMPQMQSAGSNIQPILKRAFMFLEDRDFESAYSYFEKVLDLDPECAQAYFGKLLVERKAESAEVLVSQEKDFSDSENYKKALRFGYTDVEKLNKQGLYNHAMSIYNNVRSMDDCDRAKAAFEVVRGFLDADSKIEECEERKNKVKYDAALNMLETASTISAIQAAKNKFSEIIDYADSADKIKECDNALNEFQYNYAMVCYEKNTISSLREAEDLFKLLGDYKDCKEKADISRREYTYLEANEAFGRNIIADYEKAIELYKSIPGYKDSDDKIKLSEDNIAEIKERQEKELRQRAAAIKAAKRKRNKIIALTSSVVTVTVAGLILWSTVISPTIKYNEAKDYFNNGQYEQAIAGFTALDGFRDSEQKIIEVQNAMMEAEYQNAIKLYEDGEYDKATDIFKALGDYKDSADMVKESSYQYALVCMKNEDYEKAIRYLEQSSDYKDSEEKLEEANQGYIKSQYEEACALVEVEKYYEAVKIFKSIEDYEDSNEKKLYAMYCYVNKYADHENTNTYNYLNELKKIKYKDSQEIYDELYMWKADIRFNNTVDDWDTSLSSISKYDTVHVVFELSGGTPNDSTKLSYVIRFPDGSEEDDEQDGTYFDGDQTGFYWEDGIYIDPQYGKTGQLTVFVYDEDGNKIGAEHVKIVD